MSWKWAAFVPHIPYIVPEIGQGQESLAANTTAGMKAVAQSIFEDGSADVIIILSPFQPSVPGAWFVNSSPQFFANFGQFGAPGLELNPAAAGEGLFELAERFHIEGAAASEGRDLLVDPMYGEVPNLGHDTGTLVPLYFLDRAGVAMPRIIPTNPLGLDLPQSYCLGGDLASLFSEDLSWGLIASGELSRRSSEDSPFGYSRYGEQFDAAIVEALKNCDVTPIQELTQEHLFDGNDGGIRSALVMLGLVSELCGEKNGTIRLISYETPFGVGACTAYWSAARL